VYSDMCKFSNEILKIVNSNPVLMNIVRLHNIVHLGVPSKKITRTPTLVTNDGKMHVGRDVKNWLISMIPVELTSWDTSPDFCSNLDGSECNENMFELERYGESLQPELTPDLEEKIAMSVTEALANAKERA